jgi:hypothetical protein
MFIPCDYSAKLTFENRTSTNLTIKYNQSQIDHIELYQYDDFLDLGTISAGQTETLIGPIMGGMGAVPKVFLKAADPSGNIVWQNTWSGEDFFKLDEKGFKVVIDPRTQY